MRAQYRTGGATLLRVRGVLDRGTAPLLEQRLVAEAKRCRVQPAHLLLDLSGITFLDRVGLDALLQTQAKLISVSCSLELTELSSAVVRLLHEAHLDGESRMPPGADPGR